MNKAFIIPLLAILLTACAEEKSPPKEAANDSQEKPAVIGEECFDPGIQGATASGEAVYCAVNGMETKFKWVTAPKK